MHDRSRPHPHSQSGEVGGKAACLAMFAKYWAAGSVKTRLGEAIGMGPAAELHRRFVLNLAERLSMADVPIDGAPIDGAPIDGAPIDGVRHRLFVAPDDRIPAFAAVCPERWQVESQGTGDLGQRMRRCIQRCLADSQRVVLIGSDCPTLTTERMATAFAALADHDVVLGPARDGGYYLIGVRGPWRDWMERLFDDVPWSSESVAAVTRERVAKARKQLAELPFEEDVDTLACLRRLDERLSTSSTGPRSSADAGLAAAVREALANVPPASSADPPDEGGSRQWIAGATDAQCLPSRRSRS